jgi:hypothetical protein
VKKDDYNEIAILLQILCDAAHGVPSASVGAGSSVTLAQAQQGSASGGLAHGLVAQGLAREVVLGVAEHLPARPGGQAEVVA